MANSVRSLVKGLISSNRVMMFSKSYCPFCVMAKSVLKDVGVQKFEVLEIEDRPDEGDIQNVLHSMTGIRTVPSVFVDEEYLGGGSELRRMMGEGKLQSLLKEKGLLDDMSAESANR